VSTINQANNIDNFWHTVIALNC